MTEERAKALRLKPKAYIRDFLYVAQNPNELPLSGGVFAIPALLERCRLTMDDIDMVELNEAFAAQALPVLKDLDLLDKMDEKVNVHGGACAQGHPIGSTGSRIIVTLMYALKKYGKQRGVAALCIGGGEATAVGIELL